MPRERSTYCARAAISQTRVTIVLSSRRSRLCSSITLGLGPEPIAAQILDQRRHLVPTAKNRSASRSVIARKPKGSISSVAHSASEHASTGLRRNSVCRYGSPSSAFCHDRSGLYAVMLPAISAVRGPRSF